MKSFDKGILKVQKQFMVEESASQLFTERLILKEFAFLFFPSSSLDIKANLLLTRQMEKYSKVSSDINTLSKIDFTNEISFIRFINAKYSPNAKFMHIVDFCKSVAAKIASENVSAGADEIFPALLLAISNGKPELLLANITDIERHAYKPDDGQTIYWYTQFCMAVEFLREYDFRSLSE